MTSGLAIGAAITVTPAISGGMQNGVFDVDIGATTTTRASTLGNMSGRYRQFVVIVGRASTPRLGIGLKEWRKSPISNWRNRRRVCI